MGEMQDPRYSMFNAITELSGMARVSAMYKEMFDTNAAIQSQGGKGSFWNSRQEARDATNNTVKIVKLDNKLSVFPNPSNGIINIQSAYKLNSVNVYNMIGNLVMVRNISGNQATLNIETLTNGVYFLELNSYDGSVINTKFVKK